MNSDFPFRDLFAEAGIEGTTEDFDSLPELDEKGKEIKKVTLSYEKRGAAKIVTIIKDIPEDKKAETLQFIKKALGTGGSINEESIVIQGDRRSQLTRFFEKKGVRVQGERD